MPSRLLAEALFRTAKYHPEFPLKGFADLMAARQWAMQFVQWLTAHQNTHQFSMSLAQIDLFGSRQVFRGALGCFEPVERELELLVLQDLLV